MTEFLQLVTLLIIILFAAKLAGRASVKFGQPSVFGELLVGVLLGPSVIDIAGLPFITSTHLLEFIDQLGEIGVLLLMFMAGIELHLRDLAKSSRVALFSGSLGVILPILLGYLSGLLFHMESGTALFLGLTLAATSVSISAHTLIELGFLKTRVGIGMLGAAVYDDVLVILFFSIFLASLEGSLTVSSIVWLVVRMFLYFALAGLFGYFVLPKLTRLVFRSNSPYSFISYGLIILLVYGLTAELIGNMAAITGTFLAGIFFSRLKEKEQITDGIANLAYGFFVPVFFISIGLKTNLREFSVESALFLLVVAVVAIISKILGAGFGAKLGGFSWLESYQLGNGMVSRGEVGLIIASIGAGTGLINSTILTNIVILILLTTLITPIILKNSFLNPPAFLLSVKKAHDGGVSTEPGES